MTTLSLADLFKEYARTMIETYPVEGRTPSEICMLGDLFRIGWSYHTCSSQHRKHWSLDRPEIGQCAVTALVVQDVLGGKILRCVINDFGSHYSNQFVLGGMTTLQDYTTSQFPKGTVIPKGVEADREDMLVSPDAIVAETEQRYLLLRNCVENTMRLTMGVNR